MEGFFLAPNTQITNLAVLGVVLVAFLMTAASVVVHQWNFVCDVGLINLG